MRHHGEMSVGLSVSVTGSRKPVFSLIASFVFHNQFKTLCGTLKCLATGCFDFFCSQIELFFEFVYGL